MSKLCESCNYGEYTCVKYKISRDEYGKIMEGYICYKRASTVYGIIDKCEYYELYVKKQDEL